ncbi:hypothetical protein IG631_22211 [Alternaria alternata]|nr:hypothetical protein IG631_22211 [Alternaria alternata]
MGLVRLSAAGRICRSFATNTPFLPQRSTSICNLTFFNQSPLYTSSRCRESSKTRASWGCPYVTRPRTRPAVQFDNRGASNSCRSISIASMGVSPADWQFHEMDSTLLALRALAGLCGWSASITWNLG